MKIFVYLLRTPAYRDNQLWATAHVDNDMGIADPKRVSRVVAIELDEINVECQCGNPFRANGVGCPLHDVDESYIWPIFQVPAE